MGLIHKVHGRSFMRNGSCNRCGQCCIDEMCPHFKWVDGVAICLIYDKRDQDCEECTERFGSPQGRKRNHKVCIVFPNHPGLQILKDKKCGYEFIEQDDDSN